MPIKKPSLAGHAFCPTEAGRQHFENLRCKPCTQSDCAIRAMENPDQWFYDQDGIPQCRQKDRPLMDGTQDMFGGGV